jgi:pimeloyl-ACP methyl ester carboxylesterase
MDGVREFRRGDAVTVITEAGGERADAPTFVLVHGVGMGHRYFSDLADALARAGRVLALDLPGFGEAPEPSHPQTMSEAGAYLAELIEVEALPAPVVLVGHSMGGLVIPHVARQRPVSRLVFICAMFDGNLPEPPPGVVLPAVERPAFDSSLLTID